MKAILAITLLLAGCGINPMNSPATSGRPLTAEEIRITNDARIKQELIEKLGRPLDADETAIAETSIDADAAKEMVRWLHVGRFLEFSKPVTAE